MMDKDPFIRIELDGQETLWLPRRNLLGLPMSGKGWFVRKTGRTDMPKGTLAIKAVGKKQDGTAFDSGWQTLPVDDIPGLMLAVATLSNELKDK